MHTEIIEHDGITIKFVRSRVKNINIRITHNGTVRISAPANTPLDIVLDFVSSKKDWIKEHSNKLYPMENEFFYLGESHPLSELGEKPLEEFYSETAFKVLTEQYDKLCKTISINPPMLIIKPMKGKYGYYTKDSHKIHLNSRLIMVPLECIDFVIVHELIHTIYFNHGKGFHAELRRIIPNEKELRKVLSQYVLW